MRPSNVGEPRAMAETDRTLFERPATSFEIDPLAIERVLADEANPLNRIVRSIPRGASVLDIGAGNGMLGRLLRVTNRDATVHGLEPDPVAAAMAKSCYDRLYECTAEQYLDDAGHPSEFDAVVLADVIEHFSDPERILRRLSERLSKHTRVYISTPNVAFAPIRVALLNGRFDYVESGILERTHLRFFTLKSLQKLLESSRLFAEATMFLKRNPMQMEVRIQDYSVGALTLRRILRDELASVYQFLFIVGTEPRGGAVTFHGDGGSAIVVKYLLHRARRRLAMWPRKI